MARAEKPYRGDRGSEVRGRGIDLGSRRQTEAWGVRSLPESAASAARWSGSAPWLPRKEVIQPQLPLRLPCYDFTPVTSPTFDGSLPCGLGHRLRVLLTPVV